MWLGVQVIRPMFSSPPRHGAAIVVEILSNPQLYAEWRVRTPDARASRSYDCTLCVILWVPIQFASQRFKEAPLRTPLASHDVTLCSAAWLFSLLCVCLAAYS